MLDALLQQLGSDLVRRMRVTRGRKAHADAQAIRARLRASRTSSMTKGPKVSTYSWDDAKTPLSGSLRSVFLPPQPLLLPEFLSSDTSSDSSSAWKRSCSIFLASRSSRGARLSREDDADGAAAAADGRAWGFRFWRRAGAERAASDAPCCIFVCSRLACTQTRWGGRGG